MDENLQNILEIIDESFLHNEEKKMLRERFKSKGGTRHFLP
jgi:hypothetical protein